jgi:mono/diheme cytochrome c family protein
VRRSGRLSPAAVAVAVLLAGAAGPAGCARRRGGEVGELYADYCARCHAIDGRGDPRTVVLNPNLDLTRAPLVRAGDRAEVRRRIAQGFGPMPGFARKLEPADIERLTDYTLGLKEE